MTTVSVAHWTIRSTRPPAERTPSARSPRGATTRIAAPWLVALRDFYGDLGARTFNSTQYLRHGSQPLYTPEPDIIHEVIGHGNQLASPRFARITEAAGKASLRLETDEAMKFVADVFWFSMEFGIMREHGEVKAYGAGILSSYGEMDEFAHMEHRPLDLADMGTLNYDITAYQPVLFCAESIDELEGVAITSVEVPEPAVVPDLLQAWVNERGATGQNQFENILEMQRLMTSGAFSHGLEGDFPSLAGHGASRTSRCSTRRCCSATTSSTRSRWP